MGRRPHETIRDNNVQVDISFEGHSCLFFLCSDIVLTFFSCFCFVLFFLSPTPFLFLHSMFSDKPVLEMSVCNAM